MLRWFSALSYVLWSRGLRSKQPWRACCSVRLFTAPRRSDFSLANTPVYITLMNRALICQQLTLREIAVSK